LNTRTGKKERISRIYPNALQQAKRQLILLKQVILEQQLDLRTSKRVTPFVIGEGILSFWNQWISRILLLVLL
jgi:hypothetical protein